MLALFRESEGIEIMKDKTIKLNCKGHRIVRTVTPHLIVMEESCAGDAWDEKRIHPDRILSFSEKFLKMNHGDGRSIYWEYQGGADELRTSIENLKRDFPETPLKDFPIRQN